MKTKYFFTHYIGNGCLEVSVKRVGKELTLKFVGWEVVTSCTVSFGSYEVVDSYPKNITEGGWHPSDGGGKIKETITEVFLPESRSVVVKCNAQNQSESYVRFTNNGGDLTQKILAEEYFYLEEFQGHIQEKECTEDEFTFFIHTLKSKNKISQQNLPKTINKKEIVTHNTQFFWEGDCG